ncbi:MAG: hypothetical protein Q9206_006715 [Seirophora lacunosa]
MPSPVKIAKQKLRGKMLRTTAMKQAAGPLEASKHYTSLKDVRWDIQKQERSSELKVAQHVSSAAQASKAILIDCFAGVGGNAIAFARSGRWKRVYAIEKDEAVILCGKHNAKVYGVDQKISWFHGDCFDILKNDLSTLGPYSIIFASPPWGGPGYRTNRVFNLTEMQPYSLNQLLESFRQLTQEIVLFLPRTSDLCQLAKQNVTQAKIHAIHYCMEGASKGMSVYFGDLGVL